MAASPKKARATSERRPLVPVTPQRLNSFQKNRFASSPLTPSNSSVVSSPFTPITNVYSSTSTFATPNSTTSSQTKFDISPADEKILKSRSLADAANSWRSRAKENGIKVSGDDVGNEADVAGNTSFLSSNRRSRQALFQTKSSDATAFISPQTARLSVEGNDSAGGRKSSSVLSTPETSRSSSTSLSLNTPSPQTSNAIVQRLRQRGSLTDPARTRRRETFGSISIKSSPLFDIEEDEVDPRVAYAPYPQAFGSPLVLTANRRGKIGARSVSAPFYNTQDSGADSDEEVEYSGIMPAVRLTKPGLRSIKSVDSFPPSKGNAGMPPIQGCSVCSASSAPLSSLSPCGHVVCSSCLTGALNIIGEKDMRCATCEEKVIAFNLLTPVMSKKMEKEGDDVGVQGDGASTGDVLDQSGGLLPSAFDGEETYSNGRKLFEVVQAPSADFQADPIPTHIGVEVVNAEPTVLRIDNVPWDVTPPTLHDFFQPFTLIGAHVLLDPKGKTLSHAYVEIAHECARDALRTVQNKTMGKGKRLRGVTVTKSSQAELMRALFPGWLGGFDGMQPTLNGLDHMSVVRTLEGGLITVGELNGLLALMRNPKSHFLKVPSLPFHSLISVLAKFPVDEDSRVFWHARVRDGLYDVTKTAVTILISRIGTDLHDQALLEGVLNSAVSFKAFSDMQNAHLMTIAEKSLPSTTGFTRRRPSTMRSTSGSTTTSQNEDLLTPDDSASVVSRSARTVGSTMSAKHHEPQNQRHAMHAPMHTFGNAFPMLSPGMQGSFPYGMPAMQHGGSPFIQYGAVGNAGVQFSRSPYDSIAHDYGISPDLVAVVAQRLALTNVQY